MLNDKARRSALRDATGGKIWVNSQDGPDGGRLSYPNLRHQPPGALVDFWNYLEA